MAITLIEINDYQLTLTQQQGRIIQSGYALVNKQQVIFGDDAWLQAKSYPLNSYCHYWQRLGYEKISSDNDQVRHFADLAFLQLQDLIGRVDTCKQVIFILPASFNKEQMSLLLGIAKACQLEVLGMVNVAISKLFNCHQGDALVFLDIGLHQSSYTQLSADEQLVVGKNHTVAGKGVFDLHKYLAQWLDQKFVNQCRFDTFHTAQTEQVLYLHLPALLQQRQDSYNIVVSDKTIVVTVKQVREKITAFFESFISTLPMLSKYYISQRFADILVNLSLSPVQDFIIIEDQTLFGTMMAKLDTIISDKSISDNGIRLTTQLPLAMVQQMVQQKPTSQQGAVSHILYQSHAYPLTSQGLYLNNDSKQALTAKPGPHTFIGLELAQCQWRLGDLAQHQVYVNAKPALGGQTLHCGDEISCKEQQAVFTLINVEKEL